MGSQHERHCQTEKAYEGGKTSETTTKDKHPKACEAQKG